MLMTCNSCGEKDIPVGTPNCPVCGQAMGMTALPPQGAAVAPISSGAPQAVAPVAVPAGISGSTTGGISVLIPLDPTGSELLNRAYTFRSGEFVSLIGRTDMSANPPIVAQIDAGKLWPDLNLTTSGENLFSRATGTFRRDTTGDIYLAHDLRSTIRIVVKHAGQTDYTPLLHGDEVRLEPDTEIRFGKNNESLAFVLR